MYSKLLEGLKKRGEKEASHSASFFAIEYMSKTALILLVFLIVRWISTPAAVAATIVCAISLRGKTITEGVLRENDDKFQTLLYYTILSLAVIFIVMGCSAWI